MARDARVDRRRHGRPARPSRPLGARRTVDPLMAAVAQTLATMDATLPASMRAVTVAVDELPTAPELATARGVCPLGRSHRGNPHTVVIYRRPIEARCATADELGRLVRDTLAELVGGVVGVKPSQAVPAYRT